MTSAAFAAEAEKCGIDYLGFIFCGKSPRHLTDSKAREIVEALCGKARRVGVFTDAPLDEMLEKARLLRLSVVQLHGAFPATVAAKLQENGLEVWKLAVSRQDVVPSYPCDAFIIDAKRPGVPGGTGLHSDWSLVSSAHDAGKKAVLAGGISPENLCKAASSGADVLDLNSSLESPRGVKSMERLAALKEKLKAFAA